MSISDVYLFCSTMSPACMPCLQFLRSYHPPVQAVRLDTKTTREAVANGKNFQIRSVPTLMVLYDDGNMQLFVGQQKVMAWLRQLLTRASTPVVPAPYAPDMSDVPEDSDDETEFVAPPPKPKKKKPGRKTRPAPAPEPEPEPEPVSSGGLYGGTPKKKKSKKKAPSEEENEEIEFMDEPPSNRPPPPPTHNLVTGMAAHKGKGSAMNSLMKSAQQMMEDRKRTLGYNEDDLPHGGF